MLVLTRNSASGFRSRKQKVDKTKTVIRFDEKMTLMIDKSNADTMTVHFKMSYREKGRVIKFTKMQRVIIIPGIAITFLDGDKSRALLGIDAHESIQVRRADYIA